MKGRVFGCIFDDLHGLRSRDEVGLEQILFETDYPHADGTWPNSRAVAHRLCVTRPGWTPSECHGFLRGNAIRATASIASGSRREHERPAHNAARAAPAAGSPTSTPATRAARRKVVRLNLAVTKALEDLAGRSGVSFADYLVLGVVRRSPGGRRTHGDREVLGRTTGGMTLTLDRLERVRAG